MNMNTAQLARVLLVASGVVVACPCVLAHDEDLRGGNLKPRVGSISNEVAQQRLQAHGLEQVEVASRGGDRIVLKALRNGQPLSLHMDPMTGAITDARDPAREIESVIGPAVGERITRRQLNVTRERIADRVLIQGAATPAP